MHTKRFLLDVNQAFTGKTARKDMYWFNWTFETVELTLNQLVDHIQAGHAFTAPFAKVLREDRKTPRLKKNVIGVQVLALDFDTEDERSSFAYLRHQGLVALFGAALYTTASHTPDKPRCRLLFVLDEELDPEEAELATAALMAKLPHADQSAKDAGRVFYGAKDCQVERLNNVLTLDELRSDIIGPYQAKIDAKKAANDQNRLKARGKRQTKATNGQVARYVQKTARRVVQEVANASAGTGQRHERLRNGSVRLYSLKKAAWLNSAAAELLSDIESQLLEAAQANGYTAKYGEEDTRRIVLSGAERATPATEPLWHGYTNHTEVKPSEDDSKPTVEPPPRPPPEPPPPAWPEEALAVDFLEEEADELLFIDVDPVPGWKEEAKPYFRHTCKSAQLKGAAINIYLEYTTFKPFTDHDWRNCEGCKNDYSYRKARQIEREAKRGQLTLAKFATVEDWTKKRKAWNGRTRNGAASVSFTPLHQDDGTVTVIHSSTHKNDPGHKLPEGDELDALVLDLCQTPGDTKNRASSGFGGEWQGSRGEGRQKKEEKKTGKPPHSYQLKTNTSTARLAKLAFFDAELNTRGSGRKDRKCADIFISLLDWQHQELVEGHEYKLEERFPHGFDNEVVKAIFSDERVKEVLKYYRTYREANEISPLTSTIEKAMDNKGDIQVVEEEQLTLFLEPNVVDGTVEHRPPPATGPPEDNLDWYLQEIAHKGR